MEPIDAKKRGIIDEVEENGAVKLKKKEFAWIIKWII
jgi:hypothetical protein